MDPKEKNREVATVLVVEDDKEICEDLAIYVQDLGHRVLTCFDGDEAIAIAKEREVTGILSDINMQRMNGIEFYKKLHKNGVFVPVAFVTGHLNVENLVLATRLGAIDILAKPYGEGEISALIQKIVAIGLRQIKIFDRLSVIESLIEPVLVQEIKDLTRQVALLRTFENAYFFPPKKPVEGV